jgi:K+/H+ antiporter YhaU regulatory subunit KhtT
MQISSHSGLKSVADCEANEVTILVVMREEVLMLAPAPEYALEIGDVLVVMGRARPVVRFSALV